MMNAVDGAGMLRWGGRLLVVVLLIIVAALAIAAGPAKAACSPNQSAYSKLLSSTPGLVGYWRLGESSGTVACDYTEHDNGSYLGGVTLGVPGAIAEDPDTALSLDGASGRVSVPASSQLNVGDTFSIEAWVKRERSKTSTNEAIASKQEGSWVLMWGESDRLTLRRSTVGNVAVANVASTDTSAWHYVVATKSGASVHLYLDGVDVTGTVTNQTMANNSQPLTIGQSTGSAFMKGSVDEVALYNTVLTPAQVTERYEAAQSHSTDPLLAAAGDIACPAGDTVHECQQGATAKLIASRHPTAVAPLGDTQYQSALPSEYDSPGAYNETWGQFNPIVHPAPGNHEYAESSSAAGYFTYFGAAAGNGDYSYELGSWHIVSLNSNCSSTRCEDSIAGTTSSAQLTWLQADLAAHPTQCILAYWHHPAFSSGWVGNSPGVLPLWNALYAAHADVVLSGHDHMYERFAQQDPSQHATGQGIREFVVGTGGETLFTMGTIQPNMEAVENHHFGALFLRLHPGSYEWTFRTTSATIVDNGSTACHNTQQTTVKLPPLVPLTLAARASSAHLRSSAMQHAATLSLSATTARARLIFSVHVARVSLRAAVSHGLAVLVHCSRACDVRVAVQMRVGDRTLTIARYLETETQIAGPFSRLLLRLPRGLAHAARPARLTLTFAGHDAANDRRTVRGAVVLR